MDKPRGRDENLSYSFEGKAGSGGVAGRLNVRDGCKKKN